MTTDPPDPRAQPEPPPLRRPPPRVPHPLLWPLVWALLQAQLLVLGLGSLLWNALALPLYLVLPRPVGRRLGRAAIAFGYRAYWRITGAVGMLHLDAAALDALREEQGLVIVANHPSLLDALMLVARLPRAACVMKASLVRNPFLGPGARLARYIRNDSARGMIELAVADLKDGGQLVLFPEGTRSPPDGLQPLHASFAMIARRARVPVQVVFIDTDSPYLGKGWPLWRLPPLPIRFAVRLGRRFPPPQDDHHALVAEVAAHLAEGLHRPGRPVP